MANIAEGQGRRSRREFLQFLSVTSGSLRELETQVILAGRLKFFQQPRVDDLLAMADKIGRLMKGLTRFLESHPGDRAKARWNEQPKTDNQKRGFTALPRMPGGPFPSTPLSLPVFSR